MRSKFHPLFPLLKRSTSSSHPPPKRGGNVLTPPGKGVGKSPPPNQPANNPHEKGWDNPPSPLAAELTPANIPVTQSRERRFYPLQKGVGTSPPPAARHYNPGDPPCSPVGLGFNLGANLTLRLTHKGVFGQHCSSSGGRQRSSRGSPLDRRCRCPRGCVARGADVEARREDRCRRERPR